MKNKNILIICYKRPFPVLSGAEVRMYQFIKMLSEENNVDLAFTSNNPNEDEKAIENICRFAYIAEKKSKYNILGMLFGYCFKGLPLQVAQEYNRSLNKIIIDHAGDYDYIIGSHIKSSKYLLNLLRYVNSGKLYFDATDSITLQSLNAYKVNKGWKKIAYFIEYRRLKKYEKKVFDNIPKSSLISKRDKDFVTNILAANASPQIITNYALDLGYKEEYRIDKDSLTFMGKMDYQPNRIAVLYFIQNIYPKIRAKRENVSFHVIGGNVPEEIMRYNNVDGIVIHGFVEDAAYYLQKSDLIIAPMRSGAGLQNKIVQAMLLGCTVITSSIGADGLDFVSDKELIVYKNDDDFVDKLLFYLDERNASLKKSIGLSARCFVKQKYGYNSVKESIIHALEGVESLCE